MSIINIHTCANCNFQLESLPGTNKMICYCCRRVVERQEPTIYNTKYIAPHPFSDVNPDMYGISYCSPHCPPRTFDPSVYRTSYSTPVPFPPPHAIYVSAFPSHEIFSIKKRIETHRR